jgi:hypothetical protein
MVKLLVMLVLLVLGLVMVVVLEVVVVIQPSNAGFRYDRPTVYLEWKGKKFIHTFVGKSL